MKEKLRKKRIRKGMLLVLAVLLLFALIGNSAGKKEGSQLNRITVSIEIRGDGENAILPPTEVKCSTGDTVYDILYLVCREKNIQMESSGTGSKYVEGIDHIYEFDNGSKSGWLFSVNGSRPEYSCSEVKVRDGDEILWEYTSKEMKSNGEF